MIQLSYRSVGSFDDGSSNFFVNIANILETALANNPKHHITGALSTSAGRFVQIIEGPEENVEALFARIEVDPRHTDIRILSRRTVTERIFGAWSMAYVGRGDADRVMTTLAESNPSATAYQTAIEALAKCIC